MTETQRILALDIGGTHTRMGMVARGGSVSAFRRFPSARWNAGDALSNLGALLENYLAEEAPGGAAAVSLGFPSAVDKSRRVLVNTPTIPQLDGVAAADALERRLGVRVFLDRDVVMLYEHAARALGLPPSGLTACFFIGTGIGNLIVLDGEPLTGARGVAGELGHIPLHGKAGRCGCGKTGCAELYAAGHALVRIREEHFTGERPDDLFSQHADHPAVREYVDALAEVLAVELVILDPDRAVLGGGVVGMPGFPMDALKGGVLRRLRGDASGMGWHIAPQADDAGVAGAGLYGFRILDKENS
ncbi:MAG TPA: allose kinase [Candidatus Limnocylindria bacterium]|nr:allose kinase [Candidatus Limnocylindria bacterium]